MARINWAGDSDGNGSSSRKRKSRAKRLEYVGWGSTKLIEFLQSLGKDTTNKISRLEVSGTVRKYISQNGLIDSSNKRKVACDDKLNNLFGTKTMNKTKVFDLLKKHYEESLGESGFFQDEPQEICTLEKRPTRTRKVVQKPRSIFAAIVSDNIKLIYLRKSLVEELAKSPETFESKMLGSFVRIKPDPNDYLQKNPYQLVQVTGVKKEPGAENFLLQVTNYMKDVSIPMLSDDNFSQAECEDLHERMKNGSLKKLTIVEMEEKARILHEDQTKHWRGRELVLLQRLIDRANEKGWRRELSEYLDKRELLKNPEEEARLLQEVPEIIEEELLPEDVDESDDEEQLSESPMSKIQETPETHNFFGGEDQQSNGFLTSNPITTPAASTGDHMDVDQQSNSIVGEETPTKESNMSQLQSGIAAVNLNNRSQAQQDPPEIIELSDDEDDELNPRVEDIQIAYNNRKESIWFYKDPYGRIQGPFSLNQLKAWYDENYFSQNFAVWKTGQTLESAVLLINVLRQVF